MVSPVGERRRGAEVVLGALVLDWDLRKGEEQCAVREEEDGKGVSSAVLPLFMVAWMPRGGMRGTACGRI
jgi:hypothetical protein